MSQQWRCVLRPLTHISTTCLPQADVLSSVDALPSSHRAGALAARSCPVPLALTCYLFLRCHRRLTALLTRFLLPRGSVEGEVIMSGLPETFALTCSCYRIRATIFKSNILRLSLLQSGGAADALPAAARFRRGRGHRQQHRGALLAVRAPGERKRPLFQ